MVFDLAIWPFCDVDDDDDMFITRANEPSAKLYCSNGMIFVAFTHIHTRCLNDDDDYYLKWWYSFVLCFGFDVIWKLSFFFLFFFFCFWWWWWCDHTMFFFVNWGRESFCVCNVSPEANNARERKDSCRTIATKTKQTNEKKK